MKTPSSHDALSGHPGPAHEASHESADQEGDALLAVLFDDAKEEASAPSLGNAGLTHPPAFPKPLQTSSTGNPGAGAPPPPPFPMALPEAIAAPSPSAVESIEIIDDLSTEADDVAPASSASNPPSSPSNTMPKIPAPPAPAVSPPAPVLAVRRGPASFEQEEEASALLLRQQQRDAWVLRAEWLRAEASAQAEPQRARTLLVVSELLAMAGEEEGARGVATDVLKLAPQSPIAHRQVRGLTIRDSGWASIADALDLETKTAPTSEAKCHGAMLGAEIARLTIGDDEGSKRRTEQAHRAMPSDPRAHVFRFSEMLAEPESTEGSPAKVRIPELAELGALPEAAQQVMSYRSPAQASGAPGATPATAYGSLLQARASATAGDAAGTISGLEGLARFSSLAKGALWLASAIAAVAPTTRARAVSALREVTSGSHGSLASRALAARAIELGDAAAARAATDSASSEAFTAGDRVALSALAGDGVDSILPWLDTLSADHELAPLAAAATAALATETSRQASHQSGVGSPRAKASAALGRALANADASALGPAVAGLVEAAPDMGLGKSLALELLVEEGAGAKVARALADWREDSELERERGMAGALVAEAAGDSDWARAEYQRLRGVDPTNETIARAAASQATPEAAAKILAEHALALEHGSRAATLLVEAAVRLAEMDDATESDALLRRALEADPELPLAYHLGERAARARADREALIEWVRARRDASGDPLDQAHDLVREALLVSEEDSAAAALLLEQALRARPSDVALREVYERLAPEPPADRATWRAERAAEATGGEAARLWLDAALELERTGDLEGAARAAHKAIQAGETSLGPILAFRIALAGHGAGEIVDQLLPLVRETTDPVERLEIYERLADLDERGRGDAASGLLWRRTILEETGGHLPTLRRVASMLTTAGRDAELEAVALDIARALEGPEAVAHAMLAARLHQLVGTWDETREAVEIAYKHQPRGTWALRQMAAHARVRGDAAASLEAERVLVERTDRPSEAATLSLRAAESAMKGGLIEDALAFLGHAKSLAPHHFVIHARLADLLEQTGNHAGAAAALEEAAQACATPPERARLLYRAAKIWHDEVSAQDKAREALEAVAAIDPSYEDVFERLQAIYVAAGARAELASLLERRLEAVTDPIERVEMEVLRGRALADVGDAAAAKRALAAALEANPDHVDALSAFAEVAAREEDWSAAEQAWIRLARLVPDPEKQAAIYYRLGEIYDDHLPNPERAELAYQEILKHVPTDTRAREKLVGLYRKQGDAARAIEQQTLLVNSAEAPEAKCQRTTELAEIYESIGDTKRSEATLLQARKTWPKDEVALGALARFYVRTNQSQAATVLLDRAVADARRALGTGRFEPYLFSTIATVAELRNRPDAAQVAHAAVASLEGGDAQMEGAGSAAGEGALDELMAPEVLSPAFRDLLRRTGALLDTAVPFDVASVRAAPFPPQLSSLADHIHELAAAYGFPSLDLHVSTVLGNVCLPVSTHPPVLVLGQPLVVSSREDVRTFLLHRALKVLQANAAPIARTAPIDLWPLIAAYLRALSPTWAPQGVDQGKLTDFYARITRALPKTPDPQLGVLAAEVIGAIGNRASTLNTVINGWGNRVGLLAVGDLNVAITGIAWAGGHPNAPPPTGKDRMTWIGRNAEARELVVFSVSDGYADARNQLDLSAGDGELVTDLIEVGD